MSSEGEMQETEERGGEAGGGGARGSLELRAEGTCGGEATGRCGRRRSKREPEVASERCKEEKRGGDAGGGVGRKRPGRARWSCGTIME